MKVNKWTMASCSRSQFSLTLMFKCITSLHICFPICMDFTHVKWTVCQELSWWLSLAKQKTIDSSMYQLQLYNSNSIIFTTHPGFANKKNYYEQFNTTIHSMLLITCSFIFDRLVQCNNFSLIFSIFIWRSSTRVKNWTSSKLLGSGNSIHLCL